MGRYTPQTPCAPRAAKHPLRVCSAPRSLKYPRRKEVPPIDFCHIPVSIIKRSEGRSAVAAAAYRSGTKLTNEWDGMTHDYTRKGGIVHAEIMLPAYAPPEFADRSILWNSVEQIEKARDSQLAREIEAALPRELSIEQQLALVRSYVKDNFVDKGMCADFAIHDKGTGNPHVHIMLTLRPLKENGQWGAKCRKAYDLDENGQRIPDGKGGWKNHREDTTDWNDKGNVEIWRAAWAAYTNRALESAGRPERIDHRSYKRQGIDKIPSVHLGPAASQMEKRGIRTDKGEVMSLTPMLNAYPDSLGGTLSDIADLLESSCKDAFGAFYILPSVFNTDLDRGFSVVDYSLNELLATPQDLERIRALGIRLKLDFILNHASVLSPQFQDLLKNGEMSKYKDFFIDWNAFWAGCGEMMPGGYIQPTPEYLHKMFFRKPGLPILMVRMPDGTEKPYWNTFYQQVDYPCPDARELVSELGMQYRSACVLTESLRIQLAAGKRPAELDLGRWETLRVPLTDLLESRRRYLGQMDLNVASPLVWKFYADTLHTLAGYGASIVRLDAFAYAHKAVGERNFLNEPGTWSLLARLQTIADADGVTLLPEIHASYGEKVYEKLAAKGYAVYDFFLPGLMIDALERGSADTLAAWAQEILDKHILTVNMLGCHDGIPMLDLKGLLPEERIQNLIDLIVTRGGMVKNLHGQKNVYYQVNATYYSALGESDAKLLLARAIQLFMPGKPQVWYLDLFAGKNDCEAVVRAGEGGHKEINRTNLTKVQIAEALEKPVVKKQLELLRLRRNCPAFAQGAKVQIESCGPELTIEWSCSGHVARLQANLQKLTYRVEIE